MTHFDMEFGEVTVIPKDGVTPHIGENGNWYLGDEDTGVRAAGKDGIDGKDGKDGLNGKDGQDGYTPVKGVDYFDGATGATGATGADGYTPQKGVDYFTEADKTELVNDVLTALPTWEGGSY